jgi:hypothetical protein
VDGPWHYREAERLLKLARADYSAEASAIRAAAQVHATLALTAATVDRRLLAGMPLGQTYNNPSAQWEPIIEGDTTNG